MGGQNGEHAVPPLAEQQELKPELVLIRHQATGELTVRVRQVRLVPQQRVWLTVGGQNGEHAVPLLVEQVELKLGLALIQHRPTEVPIVQVKPVRLVPQQRVLKFPNQAIKQQRVMELATG